MKKSTNSEQKKLTIGIIQQTPGVGGAETYMKSLVTEFIRHDQKVIIASNNEKFLRLFQEFSLQTFTIPVILDVIGNYRGLVKSTFFSPYATVYYIKLLKEFKKQNVSVLLMSGFSEKMLVSFLSFFFKMPIVWIEYGPLKTIFNRNFYLPCLLYRLLHKIPRRIIVPSSNTWQSMIMDAHISPAKLALIPCGINTSVIKKRRRLQDFPELEGKFIIGNVSRLTREKGQQFLIQAMPGVIKEISNVHLLLIGDGADRNYYTDLVKKLDIEKYVTITGFVKNLADYYSLMDLFVFATVWDLEGFGLVAPEAMSYKIPVIGNDRKPVSEIIKNGKSGLLVDVTDTDALTKKIVDLAKDEKKRKELGENGYKEVKEQYDINNVAQKFIDIFYTADYLAK